MLAVDYAFYAGVYRGTLAEAEFERLSVFAGACLEELTMGRAGKDLSESQRRSASLALCAITDARARAEARAGVAAESNDGVSVTYLSDSARQRELYEAAAVYLGPAGLLYRGGA